ncbi:MAG TPA: glycosyltransferase family 2 protein [bacterium]|nr:glycosyltransferase family 2 protein [bacterium]HPL95340.1 glycosyltransferase family 2 protein [bacterium]
MVYLIILVWNGLKYLPRLFHDLENLAYPPEKIKIIALDSNSTDGSREFLEKLNLPNFSLIELEKNFGFALGNNIGMQYALAHGADYLVLLNQDISVEQNFLTELVDKTKTDPKIGVVQPLILYYQNHQEINSCGNELHYLGYGWTNGNHQKINNSPQLTSLEDITYASGAAVLYTASMLKKIGLFDKKYFSYHEDSDLCLRARLQGYKIVLATKSVVYHDYHFPTQKNPQRYFWMEKNRLYLILKFYQWKTLFLILLMELIMSFGQLLFSLKNGYFWQFIKSRLWLLWHWFEIMTERKIIQAQRQIGDKELLKNFQAEIRFQETKNFLLDKIGNPLMKWYWQIIKKLI